MNANIVTPGIGVTKCDLGPTSTMTSRTTTNLNERHKNGLDVRILAVQLDRRRASRPQRVRSAVTGMAVT